MYRKLYLLLILKRIYFLQAIKNRLFGRLCRFCVVFRFGGREKSPHDAGGLNCEVLCLIRRVSGKSFVQMGA
uniref:Uncharacterized protein n=1 Tax=Siphoviridae sp. ctYgF8 TaxID=2826378 RepID=A0A8S5NJS2_9CAUD|nr:MAG TPA: hypothetical protein [Siphoviridae sp. ctYgF8]